MTFPLGSDFSCVEDIDANMTPVAGRLGLAQSVARRYISPTGSLFYDGDYGDDIRRYVNSPGPTEMRASAAAEGEAEKDERVDRADVEAFKAGSELELKVVLTDGAGPFDLTISVDELSASLLIESGEQ